MAWLDASHRRHAADRRELQASCLAEAAQTEPHRHSRCLSSVRFNAGAGPPPEGDRRLQGVDAGSLTRPTGRSAADTAKIYIDPSSPSCRTRFPHLSRSEAI